MSTPQTTCSRGSICDWTRLCAHLSGLAARCASAEWRENSAAGEAPTAFVWSGSCCLRARRRARLGFGASGVG